jgi:hypothetical protein
LIRRALVMLAMMGCQSGEIETPPYCPDLLTCEAAVEATCVGPATPVTLADPSVCEAAEVTSTAVAEYPVGATAVSYTSVLGDQTESCEVVVTVVDPDAPTVTCPDRVQLVRGAPGERFPAPSDGASASDRCDEAPALTWEPAEVDAPASTVTFTATDASGNTATCQTAVQILDLFPATGLRILSATLNDTGTTAVTLGWEPGDGADVVSWRVERGASADGPWTAIGEVPADAVLFSDPALPGAGAFYRVVPASGDLVGPATPPVQAWSIAGDVYHEVGVRVPSVSFPTDLYGIVRHPADLDGGPYPLVLLLHGNHGNCRRTGTTLDYCGALTGHECTFAGYETAPNADGMLFQAETLAAQGMIAVTLSANALNCRNNPSSWIPQRVEYLLENLRRWKAWHEGADGALGTTFAGAVDLSRVGLVGHSRGGDAVANVPRRLTETPIDGVTVQSIFSIAPTDNLTARVGAAHYATLLPACDGDVSTLVGARIHDRSLDDPYERAQVLYVGANHNFFNTEWTFDDGSRVCPSSARLSERPHTAMLEATLGAWFAGTLTGDALDPFLKADDDTPRSIEAWAGQGLDLRWSYHAPGVSLIDRFDHEGSPGVNRTGGANAFDDFTQWFRCFGRTGFDAGGCGTAFLHDKSAVYLRWDDGQPAVARFGLDGLDVGGFPTLSFRVTSRFSTWNEGRTEQDFVLRLIDADGDTYEVPVTEVRPIPHIYVANNVREVLQTVRLPLAQVDRSVDLDRLTAFELDFSRDGRRGSVLVTDVELAD